VEKMMEKETSHKRELIEYFDLFFGIYNAFVMSFMIVILYMSPFLVMITHLLIIIMVIGMIFTFLKRNPFFMYFVFSTLLCGAFYSLPGILIIPASNFSYGIFDYFIFGIAICEIFYFIIKTKESALYALENPELAQIQEEKALAAELKEKQEKQEYNRLYKKSWILIISIISALGYYIVYFYAFTL
jgi:hypothetical protein